MTRSSRIPGCRRGALVMALALVVAACGGGSGSPAETSEPPSTPATTTTSTATTSQTTTTGATSPPSTGDPQPGSTTKPAPPPSQSDQDARRDGVVPAVAALPMDVRVEIIDAVTTGEGIWAITRLTAEADEYADGCQLGRPGGRYPTDVICTFEYGEVLLLDSTGTDIVRAYPLPGVPAEFIAVTDDAVYCGRHGELPMPDSMVCRIDRNSLAESVKVYQPGLDSLIVQPCFFPPATWSVVEEPLEMLDLVATSGGVFARDLAGTWTMLDATTLLVVDRELESPDIGGGG